VLDPRDGHAWIDLAEGAAFASDSARAADALGKALALDPDKQEVYSWGLQMGQPKWYSDPAALDRIATLAAAEPWDNSQAATEIASNLRSAGFTAQADGVLSGFITRERTRIAKTPSDVILHWDLAAALAAQGTSPALRGASLEYRIAEHLMPNAPTIHYGLGDVLDRRNRQTEAIAEYRKAAMLDPFDAEVHSSLGYDLKHTHQFSAALTSCGWRCA